MLRRIAILMAGVAVLLAAVPGPLATAAPAPTIRIAAEPPMLNPTGQGQYTESTLTLFSTEFATEQELAVQIEDSTGKIYRTLPMHNAGDADPATYAAKLDGKDSTGAPLPDGTYRIRVMKGAASYVHTSITVDSVLPRLVSARVAPNPFGPSTRVQAQFSEFVYWHVSIYSAAGEYMAAFQGKGTMADDLWDGRDFRGEQVPDGTYRVQFLLHDGGGNEVKAEGPTFRRKQSLGIREYQISRKAIAPGSPETGTASITVTVDDAVTYRWDLLGADGLPLRSVGGGAGPDTPVKIIFDGSSRDGTVLPAGRYKWTLVIKDDYGNSSTGNGDFTVDPDPPQLKVGPAPVVTLQELLYLPISAVDANGVQVSLLRTGENGWSEAITVDTSAAEVAIPLVGGTQTITIAAVDGLGNTATHTFVTTRVTEPRLGVFVGGRPVRSEVEPEIVENRTMLPLRAVAEALGFDIKWDEATRTITMSKDGKTVTMSIGSKVASVDGASREMEVAPFIREGRTMVPVRFISEGLGFAITWDEKTRSVIIE